MTGIIRRTALIAACLFACAGLAAAQGEWREDGLIFCPKPGSQHSPAVCSDGWGGMIVVWADQRDGAPDIYAQKINNWGFPIWNEDGVPICTGAPGDQVFPAVASDGMGGAYIVWLRIVSASSLDAIYAQHVNADGAVSWTADGIPLTTGSGYDVGPPAITATEDFAAVVAMCHAGGGTYDIYAQRLEAGSGKVWAEWGLVVCDAANSQYNPQICCLRGAETAIVWEDFRNASHTDIWGRSLDGEGGNLWYWSGPTVLIDEPGYQRYPDIVPDGQGGFYFCWQDERSDGMGDVYIGRIDNSGSTWSFSGVPVCVLGGGQQYPRVVAASLGVFVFWEDNRPGAYGDLYMQYLDRTLTARWAADGIVLCDADKRQWLRDVAPDGDDGALVIWEDERLDNDFDLFAQRVSSAGYGYWEDDGAPVSLRDGDQSWAVLTQDGEGGLLTAWVDLHEGTYQIAAQRIERNGYWGYPAPWLHGSSDVPLDQGGEVLLWIGASRLDPWPEELIYMYSVWRSLPVYEKSRRPTATPGWRELTLADGPPKAPVVRIQKVDGQEFFWELTGTFDAHGRTSYMATAPTWFDAGEHLFQVVAHSVHAYDWFSNLAVGFSEDNLAPAAPARLAGEAQYAPEGLSLSWAPNAEPDLAGYRVYRGLDPGFVPDPVNMLGAPADTVWFDGGWDQGAWWYKVGAVDVHGNESPWAAIGPDGLTGVGDAPALRTALLGNRPNPFNPRTEVLYALAREGRVTLKVYDAAGRLVRTLCDEPRPRGRHAAVWDGADARGAPCASGVYLVRFRGGGVEAAHRMLLLR